MNNRLELTLGAIFITTLLFGQEIKKDEIVRFGIKSITTIDGDSHVKSIEYYDSEGHLIKIGDKDEGEIRIVRQFNYNPNKLLAEEILFDSRGGVIRTFKYYYDSKSQLIKKENIEHGSSIDGTWVYDYDEIGNRIKETRKSVTSGNSVTIFKYSGRQLIEEETTDERI